MFSRILISLPAVRENQLYEQTNIKKSKKNRPFFSFFTVTSSSNCSLVLPELLIFSFSLISLYKRIELTLTGQLNSRRQEGIGIRGHEHEQRHSTADEAGQSFVCAKSFSSVFPFQLTFYRSCTTQKASKG